VLNRQHARVSVVRRGHPGQRATANKRRACVGARGSAQTAAAKAAALNTPPCRRTRTHTHTHTQTHTYMHTHLNQCSRS
jgi:hypothetical protein